MKAKVRDIIAVMEKHFPTYLAESWDNCGLQAGSLNSSANKIIISLDLDENILEQAIAHQADMIITHHPLLFKPIKFINYDKPPGNIIKRLIKNNISVYSAHTNLDSADRGVNQLLAETIGLRNIMPLDKSRQERFYKLAVYVPVDSVNEVRKAINKAGAGFTGKYSDCSFRSRGIGTFMPRQGTRPYIGTTGEIEEVDEYRLETIVPEYLISEVLNEMHRVHPYEEVAYDLYLLANEGHIFSLGRKGNLPVPMALKDFAAIVKERLRLDDVRVVGDLRRTISKVAVVSGSGADFLNSAREQGIEVMVTGDVKYHQAKDSDAAGVAVVDAGHQGTEEIIIDYLRQLLTTELTELKYDTEVISIQSARCFKTV